MSKFYRVLLKANAAKNAKMSISVKHEDSNTQTNEHEELELELEKKPIRKVL